MNRLLALFVVIPSLLCGCAGSPAYREGQDLAVAGRQDEALVKFRTANAEEPDNARYRTTYLTYREQQIARWLDQAYAAVNAGHESEAELIFRHVLEEDPANVRARNALVDIARHARHNALLAEATTALKNQDYELAADRLRIILSENPGNVKAVELKKSLDEKIDSHRLPPRLSTVLKRPLTIEFKDAPLRQIFEILSRTSGLNFVFDKEVKGDQTATIFLRNSSVQDAINLLLLTNQLEQRVLDANSILIYPNTLAKLKDYQALVVKTFVLSNIDAKSAANTIKTIIKTRDLVVDEKQNLVTMRDTPDAVRMAEKLITLYDSDVPEVMLDVAILEVARTSLTSLGVQWPDQLSLSPLSLSGETLTLEKLRNIDSRTTAAKVGPMTINAGKTDGNVNLLANPRIRVRNLESAKILIGDRLPNITSTSTSTGFVSENIQYVEVGLKLDVQPTIYANDEVSIKIALEVSSVVDKITTTTGGLAYQIGTRTASTVLRLRDGENQVLAGLIRTERTSSGKRVPGLGDIPVLGRLFGSQTDESDKTEIVLSITPRLVRSVRRPDAGYTEFDSGTETRLRDARDSGFSMSAPPPPESSLRVAPFADADKPVNASNMPGAGPAPSSGAPLPSGVLPNPVKPVGAGNIPSAVPGAVPGAPGELGETEGVGAPPPPTTFALQAPPQVRKGERFTLQLAIQPGEPVTGIPLALAYDPGVLDVIDVVEGDFLRQNSGSTNFSSRIDKASGQVFATITRSDPSAAAAAGNVISVSFRAIAASTESRIQFTALAPIGVQGRAVSAAFPAARILTVKP